MFRNLRLFILIFLLSHLQDASAQYYYNDIWNAEQLNKEFKILKNEEIRIVSLKSYEGNGELNEDFFCEKRIDKNFTNTETVTRSNVTDQSLLTSFFNSNGLIIKTIDSTETSVSTTEYEYDKKNIKTVKAFTRNSDGSYSISQAHEYIYSADNKLVKMINTKNNVIISNVNFTTDDKGNVLDEEEVIGNTKGQKYFYYYDTKNQLTDVVHYNQRAKRLLPDYMYEHNNAGQITQMITVNAGEGDYHIWRYTYNDRRLKETEKFFSKQKALLGTIEYQYKQR